MESPDAQSGRDPNVADLRARIRELQESETRRLRQLAREQAALEALFESAQVGIVMGPNDGTVDRVNDEFTRIFGYTTEEAAGRSIDDLIAFPEDRDRAVEATKRVAQGERFAFEGVRRRKDGSPVHVSIIASPVLMDGAQVGVHGIFRDLSGRKEAEAALRLEQARLEHLFETAQEGIVMADNDGRVRRVNSEFTRIFGYPQAEAEGTYIDELVAPAGNIGEAVSLTKRVAGGEAVSLEAVRRRRDGSPVHVSILASPIVIEGRQQGVYAIYRDIEERHRAEQVLRQSERHYRSLFENAHDAILIFRPEDETVLDVNRRACELYGFSRSEFVGLSLRSISKDIGGGETNLRETLERGSFHRFETTQFRKDGSEMALEINASVVDFLGKPAVLSINRDVSARMEAQKELAESEEKYRAVLEQSLDCIYLAEAETGRIVEANRALRNLVGYSREKILDKTIYDLVAHPRKDVEENVHRALKEGYINLGERQWRLRDGRTITVDVYVNRVFWRDRDLICVVARDVTQKKKAEEERARLQAQLNQSQKMEAVGLLAGGIAHDFNNLLTPIIGLVEMSLPGLGESHPVRENLITVRETAAKAARLTQKILQFSSQQPLDVRPLRVNDVVSEMARMLERVVGEDVDVSLGLTPDLPLVRADEGCLEQVILNLAVNARDAMPEGGGLRIETARVAPEAVPRETADAEPGRIYVRLTVEDTGIGMEEEVRKHLFEPFYTTKEAGRGTGLGLSVVFGIVRQHEGWIDVRSEPGRGAAFHVHLPAEAEPSKGAAPVEAGERGETGRGEKVLLVEDDPGVREFARAALAGAGYAVVEAADADEAWNRFREAGDFALVFTDVVLPGDSGVDLARRVLEAAPRTSLLLTTGHPGEKSRWSTILEKGHPFLPKPYGVTALLRAVREALQGERGS
ncbi:MAG: hybrid sensor histidine kinase/response regulator [Planctomycetota bacterium]